MASTEIKKILLVEDNPKDVELILIALKTCNLANQVDVVQDGQEALDYLTRSGPYSERPDGYPVVVLLDLKLPKVNGLEVLERIRGIRSVENLPVVVLTSSRENPDVTQAYKLGANAYVVKPLEFEQFIAAVKTLGIFWAVFNEPREGESNCGSGIRCQVSGVT